MKTKRLNRPLSLLLAVLLLVGCLTVPANAATLENSGTVTIQQAGYGKYLSKTTGGTIGGGYWKYTSNDGLTGTAYCVNHGLKGVSPSKALTVQEYNRNPQTMGVFASGYPNRTLEQFKELHQSDVRGVASLTEDEYKYATQLAIWATCGQLAVPGTSFTAGRETLAVPTSDAQKIRIFDSVKIMLDLSQHWDKHLYTGLSVRAEENRDVRGVEIINEYGLAGAAKDGTDGIKKETINGREYYTRVMYVASATSTWIDDRTTKVYSTDAPAGTIFMAENNSPLETVQENGATCYKVDTSRSRNTNLNANGSEYYGAFKVCIPVDNVVDEGSFTVRATGGVAQYNLFLAYNPTASEQSYIISDPGYTTLDAQAAFTWKSKEVLDEDASLQVIKAGAGGAPLEGAEFTLTGSGGTTVTGTTDRSGQIIWRNLPADEKFTLVETAAPEGYQIIAPMNVTLTPGRTSYLTVTDDVERGFTIKKVDAQNKGSLQGAVFRFEQIDGSYKTTGITGFDGTISFQGDELPYGSYRISEQTPPDGYVRSSRVETVEWDGTKDVTITWENVRDISLTILKVDEKSGVSLPNASFDVFADGKFITSVTTNDDGEARVTGIRKEAYIEVVETAPPAGYILDKTPHGIHIDPYDPAIEDDPVLTVTNKAQCSLRIIKYDRLSHSPMQGVTFEVFRDAVSLGRYETDSEGIILLSGLMPGTYRAVEVDTGDDGHILEREAQEIELQAGDDIRELIFFNDKLPGIHLVKVDSADLSKTISGAKFSIEAVDGSYGPAEFTTGADGVIDLSKLPTGAYVVTELECPGYVVDEAQRIIHLYPNQTAQFVFTNTELPKLRLLKTSADGTPLEGVSFRIAYVEDGTHYLDRTTDKNGEILVEGLEPGVLSIVETATLPDHILDQTEHHVELVPGKTSEIRLKNDRRPNLTVHKEDADTGEPIANTVFTVKSVESNTIDEIRTGADGNATLENLLPGVYEIIEKSVPSTHLQDADPQLVTLYPNEDNTVYFRNHKKPTLTIYKVDSITKSPIKGAKFQIWYGSNNTTTGELNDLGTKFTDANGQIYLDQLRDGWYKVTELEPAAGFTIKEPATQEVYIKGGENKVLTYENVPLNAIAVEKYDSVSGEALGGCTFQLRYLAGTSGTGGTVIGQKVTGSNGMALWTGLKPGAYVIEEVDPGNGYSIIQSSETVYLADSGEQSVVTVRFENMPDGLLLVRKVCAVNPSVTLPNAEFKIMYADGTLIGDSNGIFRTDENGEIRISGLKPGKSVIVTETAPPPGFAIDTQSQTIQIKEGRTVSLTFKDMPLGQLIIQKRGPDNEVLEGVEFRVTTAVGCEVGLDGVIGTSSLTQNGIFRTDAQGEIKLTRLAPGAYVISEISTKEGYVIDNPSTNVVIGPNGDTQTVVIKNSRAGSLLITKKDSKTLEPLAGVQFYVTDSSGHVVGNSNGYYTTDSAGTILIDNLTPGDTLVVKESRAKDGYLLDDTPQTVKIKANETVSLEFLNQPAGSLVVLKRSSLTGEPLMGVTFKITTSTGEFVPDENGKLSSNGIYHTDKEGKITINGVVGTLVVTEVQSIPGYTIDKNSQTQTVVVNPNDTQTLYFYNTPSTTLVLEKYIAGTDNKPLKGVTFLVTDSSGAVVGKSNGEYITDEAGRIVITDLEPGITVTAREIKTVEGYVLDGSPKSILIQEGEVQTLRFYNEQAGTLLVKKLDSLTKKPLANVEFSITYANGGFVDDANGHLSSNGIYWTDSNGEIRISGITGTVVVREEKTIPGYTIDESTRTQTVTINPADTQTLYFYNTPGTTLTIQKYIEGSNNEPLAGVTFLVTDSGGTPLGPNKGEYITDRNGQIVLTDIEPGTTITAKEVKTVSGFVLDGTPQSILIKAGEGQQLTFFNKRAGGLELVKVSESDKTQRIPNVTFEIRKMDGGLIDTVTTDSKGRVYAALDAGDYYCVETEAAQGFKLDATPHYFTIKDNETTTVTVTNKPFSGILLHKTDSVTGQGIYGVSFLLYDSSMTPIGQYTSDNTGYVYIENLTVSGRYYLRELENPGYVVDTQMKTVYVTAGTTTLVEWKNTPITGQIQIVKKSAEYNSVNGLPAGTLLEGATFEIYNERTGNKVDTIVTGANGLASSKQLPLGRYIIREVKAPANYSPNGADITAVLEYSGQIVKFEVTNKSANTGVAITKTGPKEAMSGQPVRYVLSGIGNTGNVTLQSFYWRDTLPAQVRLESIVTGTYNYPGNYKIVYKVNGTGDYRTLADNLSTSKNYTLAASPVALGLASNERVTEIMFVFGQAPGGFGQVEAPMVYCTAVNGLTAGSSFVNVADVGGVYNGVWVQSVSRWVTAVYGKPTPLPRTGY